MIKLELITVYIVVIFFFFFSSRRRHTRLQGDWSSDVCSSDLPKSAAVYAHNGGSSPIKLSVHGGRFRRALKDSFAPSGEGESLLVGVEFQIGRASCRERV